ncbi:MAG: type II toxin-antitoxin system RelE/ParE family toxin [Mesorhizobium sp.]
MATVGDVSPFRRAGRGRWKRHSPCRRRSYVTFYRVDADAVEILRVLHGRRNIERDEVES